MSNWVDDDLPNLPNKSDRVTQTSATKQWGAADAAITKAALGDTRTKLLNGEVIPNPRGATAVSPSGRYRYRCTADGRVEYSENGESYRPLFNTFHVRISGTRGNGIADDIASLRAVLIKAFNAGGGVIECDPTMIMRVTDEWEVGARWIDPDDVDGVTELDDAASFDPTKYNEARAWPPIVIKGNGAVLWGDFTASEGKPILSYFIGESHAKANQDNYGVFDLTVVGKEGYIPSVDGIAPPTPNFAGTTAVFPSGNKQVGFFAALSPVKLGRVAVRECRRGGVLSDCYSSYRHDITASHCVDGWTFIGDNGGVAVNIKATLCRGIALRATGQTATYVGFISEQNAVDYDVAGCDGLTLVEPYLENTTVGDTDFGIKLGDIANAGASQVINLRVLGGHLYRQYGGSVRFHSAVYVKFDGFRSYTTGAVVNNDLCSILIETYPMDFAAGAYVAAAVTQFCPGQPGGTLQLAGASGQVCMTLVQGARLALGGGPYLYSDGSRVITLAGGYFGGNLEVGGTLYLAGQIAGPGGASAQVYNNNCNDGGLGHDFLVPITLTSGKIARFRHGGGEKLFIDKDGQPENMTNGGGVVLRSPDGTRYKLSIANGGTATIAAA